MERRLEFRKFFECILHSLVALHILIVQTHVKKNVSLGYNFVAFEHSLVLRAATYNGDCFYQTLAPLSKDTFLTDVLEMENLMVIFTC